MTGNGQSHENDLRPRELLAIAALLSEPTIKRAADAIGLSEKTIRRYLAKPTFRDAYAKARREAFGSALQRLQEAAGVAVRTLIEIAADEAAKPADRLRAANSIIDFGIRGAELLVFSERLARLEERSEQNGGMLQ